MSPGAEKPVTQGELSALRELIEEKFRSVNLRIALAVVGGQAVAAMVARFSGAPSPSDVAHTALGLFS